MHKIQQNLKLISELALFLEDELQEDSDCPAAAHIAPLVHYLSITTSNRLIEIKDESLGPRLAG